MVMENKKIKWGCIQPLTGGMYLGAEEAIGHPAEWILSYKGLCDIKKNNNGEIVMAANEFNLISYLEKHNKMPKYYQITDRKMFDDNIDDLEPNIVLNDIPMQPDYSDLDLIVAVPVCSGLSMVTKCSDETRSSRNNNLLWITNYCLNVIKPKCYIFENAPTLMGDRGDILREILEKYAEDAGYSVLYYKTDTYYHENCQKRPRTFVIFTKHLTDNKYECPLLFDYVDEHINVKEFFEKIPDGLTLQEPVKSKPHNYMLVDYVKSLLGDKYKEQIEASLMRYVENNNLLESFIEFINNSNKYNKDDKNNAISYIKHILYKRSIGKNYYADDVCSFIGDKFPAVLFRNIPNMLHPFKDDICSARDYLTLMGHPFDFELYGDESNLPRIGQNVPVKTAKFIVSQAVKNLLTNDKIIDNTVNIVFQDNIVKNSTKIIKPIALF